MNVFDLAIHQFGSPINHKDLDMVVALRLLSRMYESGTIGYLCTMDDCLRSEVTAQLKVVDEFWATQVVAQRLIGRVWERPLNAFGFPLN